MPNTPQPAVPGGQQYPGVSVIYPAQPAGTGVLTGGGANNLLLLGVG